MDFLDFFLQQLQGPELQPGQAPVRPDPADQYRTLLPAPIAVGLDQGQWQADQLLDQWVNGGPLHPYLPDDTEEWWRSLYGPRPGVDPPPLQVPYEPYRGEIG